ncbi:MAG TPA: cytochrome c biogenesis protein CcsA [Candidatus Helicobacter avicola]|nr:cytochrome c biogenesis protein CcsA [Candidatus Helicobacter avicola]
MKIIHKILQYFFSFKCTLPLLFIYACLCALATFVENDFGVQDARFLIYDTKFFDTLHILLGLNLIGIFLRTKSWKQKKWATLIFHASFVVIVIGAGITRYFGIEGVMHIRESQSSDVFITQNEYIIVIASIDGAIYQTHFPIHINALHNYAQLYNAYLPAPLARILEKCCDRQIPFAFEPQSIPLQKGTLNISYQDFQPAQPMIVPQPMLKLQVEYNGQSTQIALVQNFIDDTLEPFALGGAEFAISWGPMPIGLPFSIALQDFEMAKYPGSSNPSSYISRVVVQDEAQNLPFVISMNNVLDYKGYRFFQSSYDEDEQGTILSVNKDPGKIPTYIGYAMLIFGLLWSFFAKNGRFAKLSEHLKSQKLFIIPLVCMLSIPLSLYSQESQEESLEQGDRAFILHRLNALLEDSKDHANRFGELVVQDFDGRNKPIDTLAMDMIHKITKQNTLFGLNHTQLFLAMMLYYDEFRDIKLIATSTPRLREIIGVPTTQKHIAINDTYENNVYKLTNYVEEANRKKPSERDAFDKDVLEVTERINIALAILATDVFKVFPHKGDSVWVSPAEAIMSFSHEDAARVRELLESYFTSIDSALVNNDWSAANNYLKNLKDLQQEWGAALMPSSTKITIEVLLNHLDIFYRLTFVYLFVGVVLLGNVLISIVRNTPISRKFGRLMFAIVVLGFGVHTLGLILRWYVGGHAPWSNAYESMIYIAWAGALAGVSVLAKSYLNLAMASLVAGITLFVAHLGFMDPQIGNLVPVLKSYWLNIHVSVITASYGFLGLCFIAGVVTLLLFVLRNPMRTHIDQAIVNLHCINEISMIVGLALLSIGNFLGAIWANESWGRYWGWDPKETWALISIVVYTIVLHLRFIWRCNTPFVFASASVLAFYSVLMTYFGVNFYLSGKHSYASGEPIPVPVFLYVMIACTIGLIAMAYIKRKLPMPKL